MQESGGVAADWHGTTWERNWSEFAGKLGGGGGIQCCTVDLGKGEMFVTQTERDSVRTGIHEPGAQKRVGLRDDISTPQLDLMF